MTTVVPFVAYDQSVPAAMDAAGVARVLAGQTHVLLKPNLVNTSPHPVTTHPDHVAAVVRYVREHSGAEIVIAEGCGDAVLETADIFHQLGYDSMAAELGVPLLDLNAAPLRTVSDTACPVFPKMHLPEVAFTHFIISLPVLKAHSLAGVTGTLKNMVGFAPPSHYSGRGGSWKKAVFHVRMQQSVMDLNRYILPNFTVLDASLGLPQFHLGGAVSDPPVMKMIAGDDAYAVDRTACDLLGLDWRSIRHVAIGD